MAWLGMRGQPLIPNHTCEEVGTSALEKFILLKRAPSGGSVPVGRETFFAIKVFL